MVVAVGEMDSSLDAHGCERHIVLDAHNYRSAVRISEPALHCAFLLVEVMSEKSVDRQFVQNAAAVAVGFVFLYSAVLAKLGLDWWTDENYSHGLLVPFVIGLIVWIEWDELRRYASGGAIWAAAGLALLALVMLTGGTLGAELFVTRISLVLMAGAIVLYFFGTRILHVLAVPFALLLLAIPVPQIVFNRIAFPLQVFASQVAAWGIRLFDVPALRKGNVIDILPRGATQTISLEVVEACSGIRSLMTLVTLALVLGYFTRGNGPRWFANFSKPDLWRTLILLLAAVPIAVLTNAARVTGTGVLTYYYGKQATGDAWHDASGWFVYALALVLLIGANYLLRKVFGAGASGVDAEPVRRSASIRPPAALPVILLLFGAGLAVNWIANRDEVQLERQMLSTLPSRLGEWSQRGDEIKFGEQTESVLRTTDYTMREYTAADGRVANIYVGYYASQRTGATYHSPQNCLPGAGWVMSSPQYIEIRKSDGEVFRAHRYIVENGIYREVMIYWYQGRGRIEASEYTDKINTVWDSITRRRSDGAMVRVMTGVGTDEAAAVAAAADLASNLADTLPAFIPE